MTAQTSKRSLNRSDALPAAVHHNSHQVVHAVQVDGVSGRVEEAQLQRENDAVGQLGVAVQLLHVLKPLQVQRQDHGQPLHTHPGDSAQSVMDEEGANCYSTRRVKQRMAGSAADSEDANMIT